MVLYYGFAHKSMKWWKRVFFHLLDLYLVNAHILHSLADGRLTQLQFRQEVAQSLLEGYQHQRPQTTPRAPDLPLWLTETRPFLEPCPPGMRPDCRPVSPHPLPVQGLQSTVMSNPMYGTLPHPKRLQNKILDTITFTPNTYLCSLYQSFHIYHSGTSQYLPRRS